MTATGVADLATGEPLAPDMQFKIASQTKTFTANLVLQLVGEGSVGLDDTISTWVPGVPNGDQITIRQLLNHTSGLADGFTSPTVQAQVPSGCTVNELLTAEALFEPVAAPGERWSYSNYGYNLLGRVVEIVTGQDLNTALQERIATPLGLDRTLLPASGSGLTPPLTRGYGTGSTGPTQAPTAADDATDIPGSCLWAHGGMVSTLTDMRVWAESLATGSLLTPEVWAEATTDMMPFVFGGNYNGPGQWRYGLGFVETGGFSTARRAASPATSRRRCTHPSSTRPLPWCPRSLRTRSRRRRWSRRSGSHCTVTTSISGSPSQALEGNSFSDDPAE
ncbi:serine hydrolase domain-containing protein [Microbacterium atlanticum]|uniref:serine hydrolase domain-containing protein n=1 Tax=Microbacterium atlanticum TaxID=2782168 RepID=UPI001889366B|nr:serine hydrolase domain-containing protein [Microbacterium atlanticum]